MVWSRRSGSLIESAELRNGRDEQRTKRSMGEPKEDPEEAEDAEGPSDEELEAAMVEILKDAKDDFSIKDLLNKLREWSFFPRASTDTLKHSCLLGKVSLHRCHRQYTSCGLPPQFQCQHV